MNEIIPSRVLNPLHIWFDVIFLLGLVALLIVKKRYMTLLVGLGGGLLYFIVDWGIFYKVMGTREIFLNGADLPEGGKFLFLLWLSMSYGLTNFAWIWLWIKKDKHLKEFSAYILIGWLAVAIAGTGLGSSLPEFTIRRGTGVFHSVMAVYLFIAYGAVIAYNLINKKGKKLPILWMLAIGVLVQFGWEAALLLGGVRSAGYNAFDTVITLVVNSLIETNPAVPSLFLIQYLIYKWRGEDLKAVNGNVIKEDAIDGLIPNV